MSTENPRDPYARSVHIDAAVAELHRMVDAFKSRWMSDHAANPEHFPVHLSDGEWFEAFLSASTTGEGL